MKLDFMFDMVSSIIVDKLIWQTKKNAISWLYCSKLEGHFYDVHGWFESRAVKELWRMTEADSFYLC